MQLSVSKLLWIIGQIFDVNLSTFLFKHTYSGLTLKLTTTKFGVSTLETLLYRRCEMYLEPFRR